MNSRASKVIFLLFLAAAFLAFAVPSYAQDDISVEIKLDRDTIGTDEQASLSITVTGNVQNIPDPQLPSFALFEVRSQGRSSSVSIVNGQISSTVTYRYALLPTKPGTFPIQNIAVVYKNKRYKANELELTVLKQGIAAPKNLEQSAKNEDGGNKDYFIRAEVDKKDPYVNEQVTLTLKFYIAIRHSTPDLTWPTTTGFWQEALGSSTAYNQRLNGRLYKVYEIKSALFPTQTGELEIGRAIFTTRVVNDFFFAGNQITTRSQPITLHVRPLPQKGRPSDFTGTIGNFNITAKADRTDVEVNQPVTVTVRITGTGNIKSVAEPVIPESDDFRVYRASSKENTTKLHDRLGGTKIFEEVFIPKRPGTLKIPALGFNFFNPTTGLYQNTSTKAISISVKQAEGYAASSDVPYTSSGVVIGSEAQDIRYINENIGRVRPIGDTIVTHPLYLLINGLPVAVLIGLVAVRLRKEKLSSDVGYARSRAASKLARKRLAKARSLAGNNSSGEFYSEISRAVTSYVADKLNISPYGLTGDKISELLRQRGASDDLVGETVDILRKCDYARFAPSSVTDKDLRDSLEEAQDVMVKMGNVKFV